MNLSKRKIDHEFYKRKFHNFVKLTAFPGFIDNWHVQLLCEELEEFVKAVERKESPRLMICLPPRYMKSELGSIRMPAWAFGRNPDLRIIATSCSSELSEKANRETRAIMNSSKYRRIFPESCLPKLSQRKRSDGNWLDKKETTTLFEIYKEDGGMYRNAGVGGTITGFGANILIIDDTIKGFKEMHSVTVKDGHEDWYQTTSSTRVQTGGGILIINTRWVTDDLTGRILLNEENKKDDLYLKRFKQIILPAIATQDEYFHGKLVRKKGEALHPKYKSLDELLGIKAAMPNERYWGALYQQVPTDREGGFYKKEWFEILDFIKGDPIVKRVRYWDRAATEKLASNDPDYTVGLLLALGKSGTLYVEDVVRFRKTPYVSRLMIKNTAIQDGRAVRIVMEEEGGASGKESSETMKHMLKGFVFRADNVKDPKEVRAEYSSALAEGGNIKLIKGTWNKDFLDEMVIWSKDAPHKDQGDALSGAVKELSTKSLDFHALAQL